MKQVVRKGLREIVVDEVPDPLPASHHVLIRPSYSLISSGTETASIHQKNVLREVTDNPSHLRKVWDVMHTMGPIRTIAEVRAKFSEYAVLGYSGAGVIVDKHPTVSKLEIGDRVAYGGEGTGHGETIAVGENLAAKVPAGVPFEHACFTTLGSIAMNAVRICEISIGDRVAVIGLGLVGQLIAQLVRLQGGVCIGADLKDDRIERARGLGADYGLYAGSSLVDEIHAITNGRGVDAVIIAAASKSAGPCRHALEICRERGRIVVVGAVEMSFPWNEMYLKEIRLFMSRAYGPGSYDPSYEEAGQDYPFAYVRWTENRNMEEFLRLVELGRVNLAPLITHEFSLSEAPDAYRTIMAPDSNSLAVLLRYPAAASEQPAGVFKPKHRVAVARHKGKEGDVGIAVAGAGNLARWVHLPLLKKASGVALKAIYSASGTRGKSYAKRFDAEYCCSDFDQIIADEDVDAVVILTRNEHHARQALTALKAGKHVFVEKPMALTQEDCIAVCQAVMQSGKVLSVGFNRRFAPYYKEQKKQLSRRTGPAVINCRVNSPGISGSYWMADPRSGGAILGEACHFVDLMYWMLESEPISVSAYSLPTDKEEPIGENNIAASFRFEDGSIGNLTYCTVGSSASAGERVEVFAQGLGVVTEDFKRLKSPKGLLRNRSKLWPDKGYESEVRAFIDSIRRGDSNAVTAFDGARATLACLRMLESAETRHPCTIDLVGTVGAF